MPLDGWMESQTYGSYYTMSPGYPSSMEGSGECGIKFAEADIQWTELQAEEAYDRLQISNGEIAIRGLELEDIARLFPPQWGISCQQFVEQDIRFTELQSEESFERMMLINSEDADWKLLHTPFEDMDIHLTEMLAEEAFERLTMSKEEAMQRAMALENWKVVGLECLWRDAIQAIEAEEFAYGMRHFKETCLDYYECVVRELLEQEIELEYEQLMDSLELPYLCRLEEPLARLALHQEEARGRERILAHMYADREWDKILQARAVQQTSLMQEEQAARNKIDEEEQIAGAIVPLFYRELEGRRAVERLQRAAWTITMDRRGRFSTLQLNEQQERDAILSEATGLLFTMGDDLRRYIISYEEAHDWYHLMRISKPETQFVQLDIHLTEFQAEEAFERTYITKDQQACYEAIQKQAIEDWKALLVSHPDWYRNHAADHRHTQQYILAQSLAYQLSHENVEEEWREANLNAAMVRDTVATLQLQEASQRALVDATEVRERSAIVLRAVLAKTDPTAVAPAAAEAQTMLQQRAAVQAEMKSSAFSIFPLLTFNPLSPLVAPKPLPTHYLWPFNCLEPEPDESLDQPAPQLPSSCHQYPSSSQQYSSSSHQYPSSFHQYPSSTYTIPGSSQYPSSSVAPPLSSDVISGIAKMNPSMLKAFDSRQLVDALLKDEGRGRYVCIREEAIDFRTILAAQQEIKHQITRYRLLTESLQQREAIEREQQRAFAIIYTNHCNALLPVLEAIQKSERQRIGRMQVTEREILKFRYVEATTKAFQRQKVRVAMLLQRFARAYLSVEQVCTKQQEFCVQLMEWAKDEETIQQALRYNLDLYLEGLQTLEAEESQQRAHLFRYYCVASSEAFAKDRVRLVKEETSTRLNIMSVEVELRSHIVMRCETTSMELTLSVAFSQEMDHLIAKATVAHTAIIQEEERTFKDLCQKAALSYSTANMAQKQREEVEYCQRAIGRLLKAEINARAELIVLQEQVFADLLLRSRDGVLRRNAVAREIRAMKDKEIYNRQLVEADETSCYIQLYNDFGLGGTTKCWEGAGKARQRTEKEALEERTRLVLDTIQLLKQQLQVDQEVMAERARHVIVSPKVQRNHHSATSSTMRYIGRLQAWLALYQPTSFVPGTYTAEHHSAAERIQKVFRGMMDRSQANLLREKVVKLQRRKAMKEFILREQLREKAEMFAADASSLHWHKRKNDDGSPLACGGYTSPRDMISALSNSSLGTRVPARSKTPPAFTSRGSTKLQAEHWSSSEFSPTAQIFAPDTERARINRLCADILGKLQDTLDTDTQWSTKVQTLQARLPPLPQPPPGHPHRPSSMPVSPLDVDTPMWSTDLDKLHSTRRLVPISGCSALSRSLPGPGDIHPISMHSRSAPPTLPRLLSPSQSHLMRGTFPYG